MFYFTLIFYVEYILYMCIRLLGHKKAVIDSANPRSLDICLKCLMLMDFIHRILDIFAHLSMSISTLRKAITALMPSLNQF